MEYASKLLFVWPVTWDQFVLGEAIMTCRPWQHSSHGDRVTQTPPQQGGAFQRGITGYNSLSMAPCRTL